MKNVKQIDNVYYQKCRIVMLPRNKLCKINDLVENILQKRLDINKNPDIEKINKAAHQFGNWKSQHIYITSNEDIKEGDWVIFNNYKYIQKITIIYKDGTYRCKCPITNLESIQSKNIFKIIASTDKSLGLSYIPQDFIKLYVEKYNEGDVIDKILVEYIDMNDYDGDDESGTMPIWRLKTNFSNEISIKILKDSWSREEVIKLCKSAWIDGSYSGSILGSEEWIKKNLL